MPIQTDKIRKGFTPLPKTAQRLSGSVTIDGNEENTRMISTEVILPVTKGISVATVRFSNNSGYYTGKYSGNEIVKIYADFKDGTAKIFEGRLTKVTPAFNRFPQYSYVAYGYGVDAMELKVSKTYTSATDIGQIFKELIEEFLPTHTTANIDTTTGITATPTWKDKTRWGAFQELAIKYGDNGYDFYVDFDKDWHFYVKGSVVDTKNAIIYSQNLMTMTVNQNFRKTKNKVRLYGRDSKRQVMIASAEDEDDMDSTGWTRILVASETNAVTQSDLEDKAASLLTVRKTTGLSGTATCKGMPGLGRGKTIKIWEPNCQIDGAYVITEITHTIRGRNFTTAVKFYDDTAPSDDSIIQTIVNQSKKQEEQEDTPNENAMDGTFNFTFIGDSANYTLSGTKVTANNLVLASGRSSGKMTSIRKTVAKNIASAIVRPSGSNLEISTSRVSANNGVSWTTMPPDTLTAIPSSGRSKRLKVEVTLKSDSTRQNPSLRGLAVEFKFV